MDAFRSCVSLKEIELPKSVNMIYENAFADCTALTDITLNCDSVVTLTNINALPNNIEHIYVPDELYDSYLIDSIWINFADKITRISERI